MSYKGKRVAVLGASGFIGRWTARKLTEAGAELYLFVRDENSARHVFDQYGITGRIIVADFSKPEWKEDFRAARPAICFNLAGYGVDRTERDETVANALNADLPQSICNLISETKDSSWRGADLVHAGSALEYGEISGDLVETSTPQPTTLYGITKLRGTNAVATCSRDLHLKSVTARLFTVYGPGEHPGRLLPDLIQASKTGKPLHLTSGIQKRDFTFVDDVAQGLLRMGLIVAGAGEIVNLATGKLRSVREFVEDAAGILSIARDNLMFGALPVRKEEMQHGDVSIMKLRNLLSWVPETTPAEGIRKTVEFERVQA